MPAQAEVRTSEGFRRYIVQLKAARNDYDRMVKSSQRTDIDAELVDMAKKASNAAYVDVNKLETRVTNWAGDAIKAALQSSDPKALKVIDALANFLPNEASLVEPAAEATK